MGCTALIRRTSGPARTPAPRRSVAPARAAPTSCRHLRDGVDRAHLDALAAPAAPSAEHEEPAVVAGTDRLLRTCEQARTAPRARGRDGVGQRRHAYPRGVTNLPATTWLRVEPTTTTLVIPTRPTSRSPSVDSATCCPGRVASVTTATGVSRRRRSARMPSALGSCHARPRERGL